MKKLLLILTIGLITFSSALSLEPVRVTFPGAPTYAENQAVGADVYVTLSNQSTVLFTSTARTGLAFDDSGILTFQIGLSAGEAAAWEAITPAQLNSYSTLEVRIASATAAPYAQVQIKELIIAQSNTSVFVGGNLLPPTPNSTIGEDGNRFKDIYVQENSVHIGVSDGEVSNEEIEYSYNEGPTTVTGDGYGQVVVDGVNVMNITTANLDLLQNDIVEVANIDNAGTALAINNLNNQAITLGGAVTANQIGNTIGDGTENTQLTISGVNSPSGGPYTFELSVVGDAEILGFLQINGLSLLGDLDMNDNDIIHVNEIQGRSDTDVLLINSTTNGAVTIGNGDLTVGNGTTNFGTGTFTKGTGQSDFNGNLDANLGLDVIGADLTVATPALFSVNGSTGVLTSTAATNTIGANTDALQLTIDGDASGAAVDFVVDGETTVNGDLLVLETSTLTGTMDALAATNTIGDGTNALQLTIEGVANSGADELDVEGHVQIDGTLNVDGNATLNANVDLGDTDNTTDLTTFNSKVNSDIVPNGDDAFDLGSDTERWSSLYLNATSLHLGDAGEATAPLDELHVSYNGSNTANFAVNNVNPQFTINSTGSVNIDPLAVNGTNYIFTESELTVNTAPGIDVELSQDGINKNDANTQTFAFANNLAGNLNVTIDGDLNVDEQITGLNSGHALGTNGTDATVLTISGDVANPLVELVVEGETTVNGDLLVLETSTLSGTMDALAATNTIGDGTDALQLTIEGSTATGIIDFLVDGDTDINGTLNVDGNATFQEDVTLGSDNTTDLTTFNSKVNSDIVPNGNNNNFALGSNTERWSSLWVDGNAVHIGTTDNTSELELLYAANVATLNVDGATNSQFTIDAANDLVSINASDDAIAELTIDPTDALVGVSVDGDSDGNTNLRVNGTDVAIDADGDGNADVFIDPTTLGFVVNSNSSTGAEITSNASGILLDPAGDATNYTFTETGVTLSNGGTADVTVSDASIATSSAGQTFAFSNAGAGDLNVTVDGDVSVGDNLIFPTSTNAIEFQAPAAADAQTYTLPTAYPTNSGEALISTAGGVLSWGGVTLQAAYEAGNTITTDASDGSVIIAGDQSLDVRVNIENTATTTAVTINDPEGLNVLGGLYKVIMV